MRAVFALRHGKPVRHELERLVRREPLPGLDGSLAGHLRKVRVEVVPATGKAGPQTLKAIEIIWARKYLAAIDSFVKDNADYLSVPTDGKDNSTEECRLKILTMPEKLAADYTGLNFMELLDLDIIDFDLIVADAYKHMIMANKPDAVKYLNGCYAYMHDLFTADRNSTADTITII